MHGSNLAVRLEPVFLSIEAVDITKSYMLGQTKVNALNGVSVDIRAGEFVALAGPSGSGKSTLLNLLGALDQPTSGEIKIEGQSISTLNDRELSRLRSKSLGFIFQTFNLLPVLTAAENVEYSLMHSALKRSERRDLAHQALESVGLGSHFHHRPDQLSGGQRQRVAIARAIVHSPRILIADEPTASLDRKNSEGILDLLQAMNETRGISVVVATHDPVVMARAKRKFVIADGRVV